MINFNLRYWACQILGWGAWSVFTIYINLVAYRELFESLFNTPAEFESARVKFLYAVLLNFVVAIIATHIVRLIFKQMDWLRFSFNKITLFFVTGAIASGAFFYYSTDKLEKALDISIEKIRKNKRFDAAVKTEKQLGLEYITYYKKDFKPTDEQKSAIGGIQKGTRWQRDENGKWHYTETSELLGVFQSVLLTSLWLLIYLIWHYVERNRKTQLANLKLESTVKELELKTIKAHVNPHFIFNSLNSIRALVDENPERARKAITELSNLLRSSMQAEKNETVTLEKELKIVEDYLALEKIRFEDRLNVSMDIDEDTLDQQVPPMMLQTLVENAIKHGVSKEVNGGHIIIKSDFVQGHYELSVENTGKLMPTLADSEGFGIKSTQDRLQLLYGTNTKFDIKQQSSNTVLVTVKLPVKINNI